jgi:hypothetical protein
MDVAQFVSDFAYGHRPRLSLLSVQRDLGFALGRAWPGGVLPRPITVSGFPEPLATFRGQALPFPPVAPASCDPFGVG